MFSRKRRKVAGTRKEEPRRDAECTRSRDAPEKHSPVKKRGESVAGEAAAASSQSWRDDVDLEVTAAKAFTHTDRRAHNAHDVQLGSDIDLHLLPPLPPSFSLPDKLTKQTVDLMGLAKAAKEISSRDAMFIKPESASLLMTAMSELYEWTGDATTGGRLKDQLEDTAEASRLTLDEMRARTKGLAALTRQLPVEERQALADRAMPSHELMSVMTGLLHGALRASERTRTRAVYLAAQHELLACALRVLCVLRMRLIDGSVPEAWETALLRLHAEVHGAAKSSRSTPSWLELIAIQRAHLADAASVKEAGGMESDESVQRHGCSMIELQLAMLEVGLRSIPNRCNNHQAANAEAQVVMGLALTLSKGSAVNSNLTKGALKLMGHRTAKLGQSQAATLFRPLDTLDAAEVTIRLYLAASPPPERNIGHELLPRGSPDALVMEWLNRIHASVFIGTVCDMDNSEEQSLIDAVASGRMLCDDEIVQLKAIADGSSLMKRFRENNGRSLWEPQAAYLNLLTELCTDPAVHRRPELMHALLFARTSEYPIGELVGRRNCDAPSLAAMLTHGREHRTADRKLKAATLQLFEWAKGLCSLTREQDVREWLVDGFATLQAVALQPLIEVKDEIPHAVKRQLLVHATLGESAVDELIEWAEGLAGAVRSITEQLRAPVATCIFLLGKVEKILMSFSSVASTGPEILMRIAEDHVTELGLDERPLEVIAAEERWKEAREDETSQEEAEDHRLKKAVESGRMLSGSELAQLKAMANEATSRERMAKEEYEEWMLRMQRWWEPGKGRRDSHDRVVNHLVAAISSDGEVEIGTTDYAKELLGEISGVGHGKMLTDADALKLKCCDEELEYIGQLCWKLDALKSRTDPTSLALGCMLRRELRRCVEDPTLVPRGESLLKVVMSKSRECFWHRPQPIARLVEAAHMKCLHLNDLVSGALDKILYLELKLGECLLEPLGAARAALDAFQNGAGEDDPFRPNGPEVEKSAARLLRAVIATKNEMRRALETSKKASDDAKHESTESSAEDAARVEAFGKALQDVRMHLSALPDAMTVTLPHVLSDECVDAAADHAEVLGGPLELMSELMTSVECGMNEACRELIGSALEVAKHTLPQLDGTIGEELEGTHAAANDAMGMVTNALGVELSALVQKAAKKMAGEHGSKLLLYTAPSAIQKAVDIKQRSPTSRIREIAVFSARRVIASLDVTCQESLPALQAAQLFHLKEGLTYALQLAEIDERDKSVCALLRDEKAEWSSIASVLASVSRTSDGVFAEPASPVDHWSPLVTDLDSSLLMHEAAKQHLATVKKQTTSQLEQLEWALREVMQCGKDLNEARRKELTNHHLLFQITHRKYAQTFIDLFEKASERYGGDGSPEGHCALKTAIKVIEKGLTETLKASPVLGEAKLYQHFRFANVDFPRGFNGCTKLGELFDKHAALVPEILALIDPRETKFLRLSRLKRDGSAAPGAVETAILDAVIRALKKTFGDRGLDPVFPHLRGDRYTQPDDTWCNEILEVVSDEVNNRCMIRREETPIVTTKGAWDWLDTLGKAAGFEDPVAFQNFDASKFLSERLTYVHRKLPNHLRYASDLMKMQHDLSSMCSLKQELLASCKAVERVCSKYEMDDSGYVADVKLRARRVEVDSLQKMLDEYRRWLLGGQVDAIRRGGGFDVANYELAWRNALARRAVNYKPTREKKTEAQLQGRESVPSTRPAPVLSQSRQQSLSSSLVASNAHISTASASYHPIRAASAPSTPRYAAPHPPPEQPMRIPARAGTHPPIAHRAPPAPPSLSRSSVSNQKMTKASQTFQAASMAYGRPRAPSRKSPRAAVHVKGPWRAPPELQRPKPPPPHWHEPSAVEQPPWDSRAAPALRMPTKFWDRSILMDEERDRQMAMSLRLNSTTTPRREPEPLTPSQIDFWRSEIMSYRGVHYIEDLVQHERLR